MADGAAVSGHRRAFSKAEIGRLRDQMAGLSIRLMELDNRIEEDNDDALRSLAEAWHHFNELARIIDPELVAPHDEDTR